MFRGFKMAGISEGFGILSDFRELSFCGPCGLWCFFSRIQNKGNGFGG